MKLTERDFKILSSIASSPRTARHFTHGNIDQIKNPNLVQKWLDKLHDAGYIYLQDDVYYITVLGRNALDNKTGKATTKEIAWWASTYTRGDGEAGGMYQRPGSDHSHLKSFGDKC